MKLTRPNDRTDGVTFTFDVEDHLSNSDSSRFEKGTRSVLSFLDDLSVSGTFFVVGELATRSPGLIQEISAAGHEIGLHGFRHINVPDQTPAEFRSHVSRGRNLLERLVDRQVTGFRAPRFSIVRNVRWAADILAEEKFTYSSSVLPGRHPNFCFPGAPYKPFRWASGLLELPAPIIRLGFVSVPYGGLYMRLLPSFVLRLAPHLIRRGTCLWTYAHPFEFDPEEPRSKESDWGFMRRRLHHHNRRGMRHKLRKIIEKSPGLPFSERMARGEFTDVELFNA
jgi:polysaccharide deacetylase family protein (PEP-CTERM system associated)